MLKPWAIGWPIAPIGLMLFLMRRPYLPPVVGTAPLVEPQTAEQPLSRRSFLSMALKAGVGAALVGGGVLYIAGRHRYQTDIGEMGHVLLPDGSMAILNTATEIELAFTESNRHIKLGSG